MNFYAEKKIMDLQNFVYLNAYKRKSTRLYARSITVIISRVEMGFGEKFKNLCEKSLGFYTV